MFSVLHTACRSGAVHFLTLRCPSSSAGWYVLIDNHLNSDSTATDNKTLWLQYWARIMTAIDADPISKKFVMYDILNEPDSRGISWVGSGGNWGMTDYYVRSFSSCIHVFQALLALLCMLEPGLQLQLCVVNFLLGHCVDACRVHSEVSTSMN